MSEIFSLVDRATSALLLDIDWDTTLQIVDLIRQGDILPKGAINCIVVKINDSNPNVVLLALQVLECVVKNCGPPVHEYVATRDFMEEIMEVLKKSPNEEVQKRILLLLATWVYVFRSEPKYRAVQDTVNILKAEGNHIPTVTESDAMFTADAAPTWADGGCCHRCRAQFSLLRRKHHCRACGQVFCSDCSSKSSTIPKFGIEREVRVCEHCYDDINNPALDDSKPLKTESSSSSSDQKVQKASNPNHKSAEDLREEEELQLALALSKSDAENKEKEKLRATSNLLGGGGVWRPQPSSPVPTSPKSLPPEKEEIMDPEMAKYLNRSFWEQKQMKKSGIHDVETDVLPSRAFSPNMLSSPITSTKLAMPIKAMEVFQNGDAEEIDEFVSTLRGQLEMFVNGMKRNQSRGRPISSDTSVQSLFMNITAMHSQLLTYIQDQDHKRAHCEQLQDKISQIRDARAALDALREEHKEKMRQEKEEQERLRQIQMMQKLEIMRKKKQEYLEYQRQLALHRMAESERQIFNAQQPQPIPGGPVVYPPMNYPSHPQGFPPQIAGYMYPPQQLQQGGENPQPFQGGPPQQPVVGHPSQPPMSVPFAPKMAPPGSQPQLPLNPDYYALQGQPMNAGQTAPPAYVPQAHPPGPPITSPPMNSNVGAVPQMQQIAPTQTNIKEEISTETELISFD